MSIPERINKIRMSPIDYGLEGGLHIYSGEDNIYSASQKELGGASLLSNKNIENVADPEKMVIDLGNDRQLVGQLFNKGVSDNLIIYNYMWNGHYGEEKGKGPASEQHEAEHIAATFPDKQVLFINQPGFGGSSLLPEEMSKQIAKTGDYAPLGEYIGERLKEHIKSEMGHLAMIGVYGASQGALRTTGYAGRLTEVADTVRVGLVDPPGSKKHSLLGLAFAYALKEGIHTAGYRNAAEKIDPASAAKRKESAKLGTFLRDKIFKKRTEKSDRPKEKSQFMDGIKSLAKASLEKNLSNLSDAGIDRVDLYSLERSEISNNNRMKEIVSKIAGVALNLFNIKSVTHAYAKGKPVMDEILIGRLFEDYEKDKAA